MLKNVNKNIKKLLIIFLKKMKTLKKVLIKQNKNMKKYQKNY